MGIHGAGVYTVYCVYVNKEAAEDGGNGGFGLLRPGQLGIVIAGGLGVGHCPS